MMYKFVIVIFASMLAFSSATNVRKCKKGPLPESVDVEGCTQPPCNVAKGTTAAMDVHFLAKHNINSLKAEVRATAFGITVPYELPEEVADVCANLLNDAYCPIDQDEDAVYKFELHVDASYPEIPVSVEVSLKDENNESVACFVCDIKVKKGAPN